MIFKIDQATRWLRQERNGGLEEELNAAMTTVSSAEARKQEMASQLAVANLEIEHTDMDKDDLRKELLKALAEIQSLHKSLSGSEESMQRNKVREIAIAVLFPKKNVTAVLL